MQIAPRPIRRILVANRGEIAARILAAARELELETFALYTENDVGHTYNATHKVKLDSASSYMVSEDLVRVAKAHNIDAVHPGYGFLSESADFAERMAAANILVVGPGSQLLAQTGDKLSARLLAQSCGVPVLPALTIPTREIKDVENFVDEIGPPVMIKAVDGGGGRGIRLVRNREDLVSLTKRAIEESPSRQVFAEKAAVEGYRHVEVQIVGDGQGKILHMWERECSIQRRYQKIVELAPSRVTQRRIIRPVIEAAVKMAQKVNYMSLGTFEFLLNPTSSEFFFLEINPRLQVEHTVTESICCVDVVKGQLRLAQGLSLQESGFGNLNPSPIHVPGLYSIQLRITAEDPEKDYSLSIGKVNAFKFPSGNGVRVDTAFVHGYPSVVSAQFDSVIAKLIVTDRSWDDVLCKARRALADVMIQGVRTNICLLQAILLHPDFARGACDTRWLETKHHELLQKSREIENVSVQHARASATQHSSSISAVSSDLSTVFKKDNAWHFRLSSLHSKLDPKAFHIQIKRVLRNEFPASLAVEASITSSGVQPEDYRLEINSTNSSASAASSQHRMGNPSNHAHVIVPFAGTLVEVLVDIGDAVREGDVICVIKQMKMELEVRSHKAGTCIWVTEAEDGEDVAEGLLAAVIADKDGSKL